ncbi:MAG: hypothetical protein UV64_C0007G0012 [Parcubacteria group bacterium GW2011_GWC1_43_11b]|nr:MAG: hypothetical protein UV64_C0007G0012 [Parcubacteria group bacterium GW2011_GWC1_43_11b]
MTETVDLGLELATRKCPTCKGEKEVFDPGIVTRIASISPGVLPCPTCRGSGFWLQGVREKCKHCLNGIVYPFRYGAPYTEEEMADLTGIPCDLCKGLGYTVSLDVGKWLGTVRHLPQTDQQQLFLALEHTANTDAHMRRLRESYISWWLRWFCNLENPLEALWRALMVLKP